MTPPLKRWFNSDKNGAKLPNKLSQIRCIFSILIIWVSFNAMVKPTDFGKNSNRWEYSSCRHGHYLWRKNQRKTQFSVPSENSLATNYRLWRTAKKGKGLLFYPPFTLRLSCGSRASTPRQNLPSFRQYGLENCGDRSGSKCHPPNVQPVWFWHYPRTLHRKLVNQRFWNQG